MLERKMGRWILSPCLGHSRLPDNLPIQDRNSLGAVSEAEVSLSADARDRSRDSKQRDRPWSRSWLVCCTPGLPRMWGSAYSQRVSASSNWRRTPPDDQSPE